MGPYAWSPDSMSPWTQQSTPQMQPVVALGQQMEMPSQAQPADSSVEVADDQMSNQMMWQSPGLPRPSPGTPRSSHNLEETPSTPLNKVKQNLASPVVTSPWLRTPSPDHAHYNMRHFKASQQPPAQPTSDADPWAGATLMVVTQNYFAESDGYLSTAMGSQVKAIIDNPHCGDSKCGWPTYVYCSDGNGSGWVPQQILWRCFVDDNGRRWACDDATGTWCWVDEIGKTIPQQQ